MEPSGGMQAGIAGGKSRGGAYVMRLACGFELNVCLDFQLDVRFQERKICGDIAMQVHHS
jgi:hypothetical protein